MILHRKTDISEYTVPCAQLSRGKRLTLCHISDLHTDAYGDYTPQAVEYIRRRHPDVLISTGDQMDCHRDHEGRFFFSFLDRLPQMPVIVSPGNHEKRIEKAHGTSVFAETCRRRGIYYLDNSHIDLTFNGETVRFYGYIQPFRTFTRHGKTRARLVQEITDADVTAALGPCPKTPSVLLAHDPAPFDAYAQWGAPLVLSGHIHGGLIRLPLLGGVLSPARRFFPKYDAGLFRQGDSVMIVSRGLCAPIVPRIFNRPEIALITLVGGTDPE